MERGGGGDKGEGGGRKARKAGEEGEGNRAGRGQPEELPPSEGSNRLSGAPANEWLLLSVALEQPGTKRETFRETSGLPGAAFSRGDTCQSLQF